MSELPPKGVFPQLLMEEGVLEKIRAKRAEPTANLQAMRLVMVRQESCSQRRMTREEVREKFYCAPARKARADMTKEDVIIRWPALVAHLICESLGYCTPESAANIILDAAMGKENWCEWVYSCYRCDPKKPLAGCIRNRHHHRGYMSEFKKALAITFRTMITGDNPMFASWF